MTTSSRARVTLAALALTGLTLATTTAGISQASATPTTSGSSTASTATAGKPITSFPIAKGLPKADGHITRWGPTTGLKAAHRLSFCGTQVMPGKGATQSLTAGAEDPQASSIRTLVHYSTAKAATRAQNRVARVARTCGQTSKKLNVGFVTAKTGAPSLTVTRTWDYSVGFKIDQVSRSGRWLLLVSTTSNEGSTDDVASYVKATSRTSRSLVRHLSSLAR
ncbi:hypothetical protein [Nocardioides sp.]|uniref:hypothetical protein n=1 Tax=Nocardioides sp. TaxID=35761 RepID=UPI002612DAA3|nr:hypothetical protein [Nocardioides sp.]